MSYPRDTTRILRVPIWQCDRCLDFNLGTVGVQEECHTTGCGFSCLILEPRHELVIWFTSLGAVLTLHTALAGGGEPMSRRVWDNSGFQSRMRPQAEEAVRRTLEAEKALAKAQAEDVTVEDELLLVQHPRLHGRSVWAGKWKELERFRGLYVNNWTDTGSGGEGSGDPADPEG